MASMARTLLVVAALASIAVMNPSSLLAQGGYKTYPQAWGNTPSSSFYDLGTEQDRDTYLRPYPLPPYREGYYPTQPPPGRYHGAYPQFGYVYGGPFIQGNYSEYGRMGFRFGWW